MYDIKVSLETCLKLKREILELEIEKLKTEIELIDEALMRDDVGTMLAVWDSVDDKRKD